MKKLFFAAALAIVAVGGALKSNAIDAYQSGGNQAFDCANGVTLCSDLIVSPSTTLYSVPASSGLQDDEHKFTPGSTRYQ